jgi:hypothetical protein
MVPVVPQRPSREEDAATRSRLLSELHRYAGWLDKDRASGAVRADVQALAAAIDSGGDALLCLLELEEDVAQLPGGGVRKMLRRALGDIRAVLDPVTIDAEEKDRP